MTVPHFEQVDILNIIANFTEDMSHRSSLIIPFLNRSNDKTLCIIGQNPSDANEHHADKTLKYLEIFVYKNLPEYSRIIMLNLYSRIDTEKKSLSDLERTETYNELVKNIKENNDFLLVFGASKKDGAYNFHSKFDDIKAQLKEKKLFKINLKNSTEYPPHPGNPKITYSNLNYGINSFTI
ncbi:MAG: hypothetical protein COB07_05280 [Sulfurovum sp.]|nr:MAG: hypothetical protein COB07_05280 [Sulfurovum sp.]